MAKKYQKICFTLNNYTDEEHLDLIKWCLEAEQVKGALAYAIVGEEVGESGTPHLQGYINFGRNNRKSWKWLKGFIPRAHIEEAKGDDNDNKVYCSKDGKFREFGEPQRPGKRNDLSNVVDAIKSGKRVAEIAMEHSNTFVKYHRGLRELSYIVRSKHPRDFKTEVHVLIGPPGTGKSRYAADMTKTLGSVYYKPRGEWWDGYDGEDSIVIDDFYGWLKYDELLKICDRYPYQVPIKGGYVQFTSKHIFITSNVDIDRWYKFQGYDTAAIRRRIEHYHVDFVPAIPPPEIDANDDTAWLDEYLLQLESTGGFNLNEYNNDKVY